MAEVVAALPVQVRAVVVIDSAEKISGALRSAKGVQVAAFDRTAAAWNDLAEKLGWTDEEAMRELFGTRALVVVLPLERAQGERGAAKDAGGALTWCVISAVSEATQRRLRERLEAAPRELVLGQPVMAVEQGRMLIMAVRKSTAGDAPPERAGEAGLESGGARSYWIAMTPTKAEGMDFRPMSPPGAGLRLTVAAKEEGFDVDDAGVNALLRVAPALAGGGDAGAATLRGTGAPASLSAVTGGWARVLVRDENWAAHIAVGVAESDGGVGRVRGMRLTMRGAAPNLAQAMERVTPSADGLLGRVHRDGGVTVMDHAASAADAWTFLNAGLPVISGSWRERFGAEAAGTTVISLCVGKGADAGVKNGSEGALRLVWAQQVRAKDAGEFAAATDACAVKALTILETGRVPGPASFRGSQQSAAPGFAGVPPDATRSVRGASQLASMYLRAFGARPMLMWRSDVGRGWALGTAAAEETGASGEVVAGAGGAGRAERAEAAGSAALQWLSGALRAAGGGERRWIARGIVEPALVKRVAPVMFAPMLPPGQILGNVGRVEYGFWVEEAGPGPGPGAVVGAGGAGGARGAGGAGGSGGVVRGEVEVRFAGE
ncbi:hypothetical protein BH11PLA1_BH11PLA1_00240 [soil metagenome]